MYGCGCVGEGKNSAEIGTRLMAEPRSGVYCVDRAAARLTYWFGVAANEDCDLYESATIGYTPGLSRQWTRVLGAKM